MSCCFCVISLTFKKLWCNLTYSIVIFKTSHISDGINLDESSHKSPLISSCRKAPLWAHAAATRRENKKTCQRVKLKSFLRWSLALCKKQNRKNWEMVYHGLSQSNLNDHLPSSCVFIITFMFVWKPELFWSASRLRPRFIWTQSHAMVHRVQTSLFAWYQCTLYSAWLISPEAKLTAFFFSKIRLLAYEQIACNAGSFQP